jgi:hypothetical protein
VVKKYEILFTTEKLEVNKEETQFYCLTGTIGKFREGLDGGN